MKSAPSVARRHLDGGSKMVVVADFDFLCAKLHGMRSLLYEGERLEGLLKCRNLSEMYGELFADHPFQSHLQFERELVSYHVATLHDLSEFLSGKTLALYTWLLRRYQIENLKVILRHWAKKGDRAELERLLVDLPHSLSLPMDSILASPGLASLIPKIPHPLLQKGASLGAEPFERRGTAFFLETGLDKAYFTELYVLLQRLHGTHSSGSAPLVRLEVDIFNALLAFRGKLGYAVTAQDLEPFFAPGGKYLTPRLCGEIMGLDSFDEMLKQLPSGFLGSPKIEVTEIGDLERVLSERLYRTASRQFYRSVSDFGKVLAFFHVKRAELTNLIRFAESLRYGHPPGAIRRFLLFLE